MATASLTRASYRRAFLMTWLATAAWDFCCASGLSLFAYQTSIARLWRGVASVPLGAAALTGGWGYVVAGVALHCAVASAWSGLFVAALRASPRLREALRTRTGAAAIATAYGPFIWLVMSCAVIPIAAQRPPRFDGRWAVQIIAHIPFVALPLVFTARSALGLGAAAERPVASRVTCSR